MGKVKSKLFPPSENHCLWCEKWKKFASDNGVITYQDYQNLTIDKINDLRTICASCKGFQWGGFGSGSFKADLVTWWKTNTKFSLPPPGTGRTSRFSEDDIQHMKALRNENGMSWGKVAKYYGISRNTLYKLVNGHTKKLRK